MTTDKTGQVGEVRTYKVFQSRLLVDPCDRLNPDCHYRVVIYADVAVLLGERDRLREALKETIQYVEGFIRIYPLSEEAKATVFRARKALQESVA